MSLNVKNWGAVGDGVTDDTAAISAALAASKAIYFPDGKYILSAKMQKSLVGDYDSLSVQGDGPATILAWQNADGGLKLNMDDRTQSFRFDGLTMTVSQPNGGNGLEIIQTEPLADYNTSSITNIILRGDDPMGPAGVNYWSNGIRIEGACGVKYDKVTVWGNGAHDTARGKGLQIVGYAPKGASGYAIEHMVTACTFNNLDRGVDVGDLVQTVNVSSSFLLNNRCGMFNTGDDATLVNSVVNASGTCFYNDGQTLSPRIIGNYLECAKADTKGVVMVSTPSFIVANNQITFVGPLYAVGVDAVNSCGGIISGNLFSGAAIGVAFNANSHNNRLIGNTYYINTHDVTDYGSGNRDETLNNLILRKGLIFDGGSQFSASASAGGQNLPSKPYGFLAVMVNGQPFKIPLYGT